MDLGCHLFCVQRNSLNRIVQLKGIYKDQSPKTTEILYFRTTVPYYHKLLTGHSC